MPPDADLLRIDIDGDDVCQRDVEFTPECPEFIQAFDSEGHPVAVDRDVHHDLRE